MSDEQTEPVAEPTEEEAPEAPEGAAPSLATDPILGDQRTDVRTIGPGGDVPNPVPEEEEGEEEAEGDAEAKAE